MILHPIATNINEPRRKKAKIRTYLCDEKTGSYNTVKIYRLGPVRNGQRREQNNPPQLLNGKTIEEEVDEDDVEEYKLDYITTPKNSITERDKQAEEEESEEDEFDFLTTIKNPVIEKEKQEEEEYIRQMELKKKAEKKRKEEAAKSAAALKRLTKPRNTMRSTSPSESLVSKNSSVSTNDRKENVNNNQKNIKAMSKNNVQIDQTGIADFTIDVNSRTSGTKRNDKSLDGYNDSFTNGSLLQTVLKEISNGIGNELKMYDNIGNEIINQPVSDIVPSDSSPKMYNKKKKGTNFVKRNIQMIADLAKKKRKNTTLYSTKELSNGTEQLDQKDSDIANSNVSNYSDELSYKAGYISYQESLSPLESSYNINELDKMNNKMVNSRIEISDLESYDKFDRKRHMKVNRSEGNLGLKVKSFSLLHEIKKQNYKKPVYPSLQTGHSSNDNVQNNSSGSLLVQKLGNTRHIHSSKGILQNEQLIMHTKDLNDILREADLDDHKNFNEHGLLFKQHKTFEKELNQRRYLDPGRKETSFLYSSRSPSPSFNQIILEPPPNWQQKTRESGRRYKTAMTRSELSSPTGLRVIGNSHHKRNFQ